MYVEARLELTRKPSFLASSGGRNTVRTRSGDFRTTQGNWPRRTGTFSMPKVCDPRKVRRKRSKSNSDFAEAGQELFNFDPPRFADSEKLTGPAKPTLEISFSMARFPSRNFHEKRLQNHKTISPNQPEISPIPTLSHTIFAEGVRTSRSVCQQQSARFPSSRGTPKPWPPARL